MRNMTRIATQPVAAAIVMYPTLATVHSQDQPPAHSHTPPTQNERPGTLYSRTRKRSETSTQAPDDDVASALLVNGPNPAEG